MVVQDHSAFRRKKWKYFILDEVSCLVKQILAPELILILIQIIGATHQKFQVSKVANVAEFPKQSTPFAYRNSASKQFDGIVVTYALSHA